MRALCWHGKEDIRCDTVPDPRIEHPRDAIVKVTSTAICGSDLHFARHGHEMVALTEQMEGVPDLGSPKLDFEQDIWMGHEFAAEVLELAAGVVVAALPEQADRVTPRAAAPARAAVRSRQRR